MALQNPWYASWIALNTLEHNWKDLGQALHWLLRLHASQTTAVRTFALRWHSKGKHISHFIAETSIAETAAPNCPIPLHTGVRQINFYMSTLTTSKWYDSISFEENLRSVLDCSKYRPSNGAYNQKQSCKRTSFCWPI